MQQLYALMTSPVANELAERFPHAVEVGDKKIAPFIEPMRDTIEQLGDVEILTYQQAKLLVESMREEDEFNI